jgi:glycosyltransferase involved in cell wall biosynthesis
LNNYKYRLGTLLKIIYPLHIKDDYDIEVAYLECGATKVISTSTNKRAKKIAWVHCDLSKKISNIAEFKKKSAKWYKKFDKVSCVSKDVEKSFKNIYGNEFDTEVIYNVIDDYSIRERADESINDYCFDEKIPTIVSVGRLSTQKRFDRLIEAHKIILDEGFYHRLLIIGEGDERENLEQIINASGVRETVRFSGFKSNPYPYIKNADLLVCSSDYEGFSSFVAEGLILGKAIATTNCTGMAELLGDSQYGIITDCNAKALSDGIKKLLSDINLKKKYEKSASERGKSFSIDASVKQAENFFTTTK